jgi:hypothetical protein
MQNRQRCGLVVIKRNPLSLFNSKGFSIINYTFTDLKGSEIKLKQIEATVLENLTKAKELERDRENDLFLTRPGFDLKAFTDSIDKYAVTCSPNSLTELTMLYTYAREFQTLKTLLGPEQYNKKMAEIFDSINIVMKASSDFNSKSNLNFVDTTATSLANLDSLKTSVDIRMWKLNGYMVIKFSHFDTKLLYDTRVLVSQLKNSQFPLSVEEIQSLNESGFDSNSAAKLIEFYQVNTSFGIPENFGPILDTMGLDPVNIKKYEYILEAIEEQRRNIKSLPETSTNTNNQSTEVTQGPGETRKLTKSRSILNLFLRKEPVTPVNNTTVPTTQEPIRTLSLTDTTDSSETKSKLKSLRKAMSSIFRR